MKNEDNKFATDCESDSQADESVAPGSSPSAQASDCEYCSEKHGLIVELPDDQLDAHQLMITLNIEGGVKLRLESNEFNAHGRALLRKLNLFLRMLDERVQEVQHGVFNPLGVVVRTPVPPSSERKLGDRQETELLVV